jgi:hypothetical protein
LKRLQIRPHRALEEDLKQTTAALSYGGIGGPSRPAQTTSRRAEEPDFSKMTAAEKVQWNLEKWHRILGG